MSSLKCSVSHCQDQLALKATQAIAQGTISLVGAKEEVKYIRKSLVAFCDISYLHKF